MRYLFLLLISMFFYACSGWRSSSGYDEWALDTSVIELPEITVFPQEEPVYQASPTKSFDLLHTRLYVSFDWNMRQVPAKADLILKPWFYPSDTLVLDARFMEIKSVSLATSGASLPLVYNYNGQQLHIRLPKTYTRSDTLQVAIEYVAKPEEVVTPAGDAIAGANGLYFINPDSSDKSKPTQIWTQGETEYNSCWFPTIDKPNERMTQEIFITVDNRYKTLSNGELIFSEFNANGTRTDYWRMDLPHAPYLVMMAIGDYTVVRDSWTSANGKSIPVEYFVEHEYAPYAKATFGNTPEMLSFYSRILDYDYPWPKYSQVVVRDYVSGAMENTSATIHGEFLNLTDRELLDGDYESIIAHELFHHWFGDLVTCESWANLPLNESFATYGEYLWIEHKYGREDADEHLYQSRSGYFNEAYYKREDLIRFDYTDAEEMFDGHSYNKGGAILHMLRNITGDEAFFAALNLYLRDNAYQDVEIHQLRLAFEEITGQDFNWFFNQWFLDNGHPVLDITWLYLEEEKQLLLTLRQVQDLSDEPVFRMPFRVDVKSGGLVQQYRFIMEKSEQVFTIACEEEPSLVDFDPERILLCEIVNPFPQPSMVAELYKNSTSFIGRLDAVEYASMAIDDVSLNRVLINALRDPHPSIRYASLASIDPVVSQYPEIELLLNRILDSETESLVRAEAVRLLSQHFPDANYALRYQQLLSDRSYSVAAAALSALYSSNQALALEAAASFEAENNQAIVTAIARIYQRQRGAVYNAYFLSKLNSLRGPALFSFISSYGDYLMTQQKETLAPGIDAIYTHASTSPTWWIRYAAVQELKKLSIHVAALSGESSNETDLSPETIGYRELSAHVKSLLDNILKNETDSRVLGFSF
jgi:aminopeptidase N